MRLIDADALKNKLQQHHDFFVNAWGGFREMPIQYKARCDELSNSIAEIFNAPTIDIVRCKDCIWHKEIEALFKQVTGKLKNPCDSLLTDDSEDAKEHKSKLDLISKQDAIKEITVNPINESLFSADFLKGFRCGAKRQFQADAKEIAKARFGRPTGEWTMKEDGEMVCSHCGAQAGINWTTGEWIESKYCSDCGRYMWGRR